jgi:uncharacterized delta-60 repeat protein
MAPRLAALLLALAVAATAWAQAPGDLDAAFGDGGRVVVPLTPPASLSAVAVRPDGRIVAAGSAGATGVVVGLRADGTLDADFGSGGVVELPGRLVWQLALAPDGDVLVAGIAPSSTSGVFVARLDADGALDPGFGTGGITPVALRYFLPSEGPQAVESSVCGLAVLGDGRIVVGLSPQIEQGAAFFNALAAIRLSDAGVVDLGFGGGNQWGVTDVAPGGVGVANPDQFDFCSAMAIDVAGGIVLGGQHLAPSFPPAFEPTQMRLTSDGLPDPSFGTGGRALVPGFSGPGANGTVRAVAVDGLGRLVASGSPFDLARWSAAGVPDGSFGTGGVDDLPGALSIAEVAIDGQGRILASGRSALDVRFAVARVLDDGGLDPTFGSAGIASAAFDGWPLTFASAVAEDADGRIVVGGTLASDATPAGGFALARFVGRPAGFEATPLAGRRLQLESGATPTRRRLSVASVDPAIDLGLAPVDDPRIAGAALRLQYAGAAPLDVVYPLPASGWTALTKGGAVRGYRYRSKTGAIRRVVLQAGRRLRLLGRGADLPAVPAASFDPVRVTLTYGAHALCLSFGGAVQHEPGRRYRARLAAAPASCD